MIATLKTEQLIHHPKNPRKDLGDLTELADSIKTNGVMQNLTVIPVSDEMEEFYVLMGNRRLAAGKMAGIREFPCRIVEDLSDKEQIALMLEENMQRNDLTITEQAESFQLMIDLGSTVDEIKERTGFSESTIYHRLNLAKLDTKVLKRCEESESFQLNLKDLYELEKIKDIDERNRILKEATSSQILRMKVTQVLAAEKREKSIKRIIKKLEAAGIKKAPDGIDGYSKGWERFEIIFPDRPLSPQINDIIYGEDSGKGMFWHCDTYYVGILRETKNKTKSGWEIEQEEIEKKFKKIKSILNNMRQKRRSFCQAFVQLEEGDAEIDYDLCCRIASGYIARRGLFSDPAALQDYLDIKTGDELSKLPPGDILISLMSKELNGRSTVYYDGCYDEREGERFKDVYAILEAEGLDVTEEERQIIDGTHELYKENN